MKLSPQPFRHRLVCRIANEAVGEAEAVLAREFGAVGTDELLANESHEVARQLIPLALGQKRRNGSAVEEPPLDRGPLDHCAFACLEAVDARREQSLNRRRHS